MTFTPVATTATATLHPAVVDHLVGDLGEEIGDPLGPLRSHI